MSLKVSGTKGYKLLVNDDHYAEPRAAYPGRDAGVPGRQSKHWLCQPRAGADLSLGRRKSEKVEKVGDRLRLSRGLPIAATAIATLMMAVEVIFERRHLDRPGGAQTLESVNEGLLDFVVDAALVEFGGQADGVLDGVRIRAAVTDNADAFRAQ